MLKLRKANNLNALQNYFVKFVQELINPKDKMDSANTFTTSDKTGEKESEDKVALKGYLKMAVKRLDRYSDLVDAGDWKLYDDVDGVKMWTKEHETSSIYYIKRSMTVNKPLKSVMDAFQDLEICKESDDQLRDLVYCHIFNENSKIFKAKIKGNIVVYDRVLIMFTTTQEVTDGSFVMIDFSVDTDKAEVDPKCVLASSEFMVTHFEKMPDDKTTNFIIIKYNLLKISYFECKID